MSVNNDKKKRYYVTQGASAIKKYHFDGIDDYVSIPNKTLSSDFSIKVKYLITETPTSHKAIIGGNGSADGGSFAIYLHSSGERVTAQVPDGTGNQYLSIPIVLNQLTEIELTRIGTQLQFKSGAEVVEKSLPSVVNILISYIGRWSGGMYFDGVIADLNINGESLYPIRDGWDNNPTIVDVIGGDHGTAMNFNSNQWQ